MHLLQIVCRMANLGIIIEILNGLHQVGYEEVVSYFFSTKGTAFAVPTSGSDQIRNIVLYVIYVNLFLFLVLIL